MYAALKLEFLKAKILEICITNVVIPADEWDVTGVMEEPGPLS